MGKRSNFERVERDFYPTPKEAVLPLVPHLPRHFTKWFYVEPCAGNGALVGHLAELAPEAVCLFATDIEPATTWVREKDALLHEPPNSVGGAAMVITNPPWRRDVLHAMIEQFTRYSGLSAWLLFDADWMHTKQAIPYLPRLRKVVSVGRVKWIPDSKMTGKDNCCWYYFTKPSDEPTVFYGRA